MGVRAFLPGLKTYWVAWRSLGRYRPAHFHPIRSFFAKPPEPLSDRRPSEIETINESSRRYFESAESREFWLNRPFSDRPPDPSFLWRFGLLVAALRLRPGQRVLDFGCGTGWTSIMLARMGADVVGIDIAPAAVELAREVARGELTFSPGAGVRFETYSGGAIDAEDGGFDFVLVFDAFHHLPHPRQALEEFHRVLGPHGRFAFSEPGVGHRATVSSRAERERGVLEEDVDLEQLYRTALSVGFQGLDVLIPPLPPEILTLPYPRLRLYLRGMTWLVPPDFLRKEILTGPMGVFRKGPYPVTSLAPRSHRARIRSAQGALRVTAGGEVSLDVDVTNLTETVWLKEGTRGQGYVRLGAQLLRSDGTRDEQDFARAELPRDVREGETVRVTISLRGPEAPGRYTLRLDMVNEGLVWFADEGSETKDVRLEVGPENRGSATS